jgi:hypothetical protein
VCVKAKEQLGEDYLEIVDWAFPENGLNAFKDGKSIAVQSFKDYLGEDRLKRLLNWLLKYLSEIDVISLSPPPPLSLPPTPLSFSLCVCLRMCVLFRVFFVYVCCIFMHVVKETHVHRHTGTERLNDGNTKETQKH